MRVMVVGSGGREHALAWTLARSPSVEAVIAAPGNPGTAAEDEVTNVGIDVGDFAALTDLARNRGVDLTVVGPEVPLVDGIRDHFDACGLLCFGPSKAAARLEGSKSFAKEFMERHGIPTAASSLFTEFAAAESYIRAKGAPIVVKADGLAAGKGVVVAQDVDEAVDAARGMLSGDSFGSAGQRVVVEDFLEGEEASFTCIVDGQRALPFASSQDHKPRDEGDRGPNTGGMGAYSPAPVVTTDVYDRIMAEIIEPLVRGAAMDGLPYQGFLYAGLMVGPDGAPKVVEFNCRFGDPEAQPVLSRLHSDLATLCLRAVDGTGLADVALEWDPRTALGVVLTAGGYPLAYDSGDVITGLDDDLRDSKVFHAGTALSETGVVTAGGRVLCVVGLGDDIASAQRLAYERAASIHWRRISYRRDIGFRALARASG